MELNNIALYIIRSSIIFAIDIIMVLIIQNTLFKHYHYAARALWIASMIHALLPFGILNIPIGQDAVRSLGEYIRSSVNLNTVMFGVIALIFTVVIIQEIKTYRTVHNIFYVSHYDKDINAYMSCKNGPAFVWGVVIHKILIPDNDINEGGFILRHERKHAEGNDNLLKLIYTFLMCSCWFQPVIFLSRRCFDDMIEVCCDERVIEGFDKKEIAAYAKCMYNHAVSIDDTYSKSSLMCSDFVGRKSQLHKRVKALTNSDKRTFAGDIACRFIAVILVFVIFFVGTWDVKPRKHVEKIDEWVEREDIIYDEKTEYLDDVYVGVTINFNESTESYYNEDGCAVSYTYDRED